MDEKAVEAMGMKLASRAYVYRLMRIAFGAQPSAQELALLSGSESVRVMNEAASTFSAPSLAQAAQMCAGLASVDEGRMEELGVEYQRLFMVPGDAYVHAWESPYEGHSGTLFNESVLDVRKRYEAWGYRVDRSKGRYPEDHIALMTGFLAFLGVRAYVAFADGDDELANRLLAASRSFACAHLGSWVDEFTSRVLERDRIGTYAAMAVAQRDFIKADLAFFTIIDFDID